MRTVSAIFLILPTLTLLSSCNGGDELPVVTGCGEYREGEEPSEPDLTPPAIEHTPYENAINRGIDLPIRAWVTDESGIGWVYLYYREAGETPFSSAPMEEGGGAFRAVIPSTPSGEVLEYYIMAVDSSPRSNISYSPEGAPDELYILRYFDFYGFEPSCRLPLEEDIVYHLLCQDIDGDSFPDIALANWGSNRVYLNNRDGIFEQYTDFFSDNLYAWTYSLTESDFNDDGKADLFFTNYYFETQDRLYLQGNTLRDVTSTNFPSEESQTCGVAAGDIDGDGDIDIVTANAGVMNGVYINDGSGSFSEESDSRIPLDTENSRDVALSDLDGDGDPDMVFATWYGEKSLYMNDGRGYFSDHSEDIPQDSAYWAWGVEAEDFDHDGDQDLFFACEEEPSAFLYLNDGTGQFTDETSTRLPWIIGFFVDAVTADMDGDGDTDILMPCFFCQSALLLNDGNGYFTDQSSLLPADEGPTLSLSPCDIEGDGDMDILDGNGEELMGPVPGELYINEGSLVFSTSACIPLPEEARACLSGEAFDLTGDGIPELVLDCGSRLIFLSFDGTGFSDSTPAPLLQWTFGVEDLEAFDCQGDGLEDLLLLPSSRSPLILKNPGNASLEVVKGAFEDTGVLFRTGLTGDMDSDGAVDALLLDTEGFPWLFRNEGDGSCRFSGPLASWFTPTRTPLRNMAILDADLDGDMDILSITADSKILLSLNRGDGYFLSWFEIHIPGGGVEGDLIAVADLDGDDLPDGVVEGGEGLLLLMNHGGGSFSASSFVETPSTAQALSLFDGDGNLFTDILVSGESGITLFLNHDLTFEERVISSEDAGITGFLIFDLNSDYTPDFLTVADRPRLYFNR